MVRGYERERACSPGCLSLSRRARACSQAKDVWTFGSLLIKSVISFPIIWAESGLSFARESAGKLRAQDIGGGGGWGRVESVVARASGKAASSVDAGRRTKRS